MIWKGVRSVHPVVPPHAADIMRNPPSSLLARSLRSDKTGMALKGRRNCNLSHYSLSERGMFYPLSGSVDPSVRPPGSQRSRDKRQRGEREGGIYKSRIKVPFPGTSAKRQNTLKQRTSDGREGKEEDATMAETGSKISEFCAHPRDPDAGGQIDNKAALGRPGKGPPSAQS